MAALVPQVSGRFHKLREVYQVVRHGTPVDHSILLMLKDSLSLDGVENSSTDCLLLALTTLRLILEQQKHYSSVFQQLLDASGTVLNIVAGLLDSNELQVSFASCKTLIEAARGLQELPKNTLIQLGYCQKCNGMVHVLDFLSAVLSKKSGVCTGVKSQCMQHLEEQWVHLVVTCLNHPQSDSICYSFLCLWLKAVKHKREVAAIDLTEAIFFDSSLLIGKMLDQSIPANCWCRAVDVLNAMVPYVAECHDVSQETSHTMARYAPLVSNVLGAVTRGLFSSIPAVSDAGGFGSRVSYCTAERDSKLADQRAVRRVALLALKASSLKLRGLAANFPSQELLVQAQDTWKQISAIELMAVWSNELTSADGHWIVNLFADQDDKLIEAILCALDSVTSYQRIMPVGKEGVASSGCSPRLCPHYIFCAFLSSTSWDHSILLDFLTSPETGFLVYLLRYLKYLVNDWPSFVQVCEARSAISCEFEPGDPSEPLCVGTVHGKQGCSTVPTIPGKDPGDSRHMKVRSAGSKLQSLVCYSGSSDSSEDEDRMLAPLDFHHGAVPTDKQSIESLHGQEMVSKTSILKFRPHQSGAVSLELGTCGQSGVHSEAVNSQEELEDFSAKEITSDGDTCVDDSTFAEKLFKSCDLGISHTDCTKANQVLEDSMSVLIRLRLSLDRLVDKGLFPYNVAPLIGMLERCEMLYEGNHC